MSLQRVPCPVTGEFLSPTPSGDLRVEEVQFGRKKILAFGFQVRARFRPEQEEVGGERCDPRRGEYRQLVKGKFEIGGKRYPHRLHEGALLSADEFKEDGKNLPRYGHRADGRTAENNFFSDEGMEKVDETGAYFRCTDAPTLALSEKEDKPSRMELEFVGKLVDTGDSDRVLQQKTWSANYVHMPKAPLSGKIRQVSLPQPDIGEIRHA